MIYRESLKKSARIHRSSCLFLTSGESKRDETSPSLGGNVSPPSLILRSRISPKLIYVFRYFVQGLHSEVLVTLLFSISLFTDASPEYYQLFYLSLSFLYRPHSGVLPTLFLSLLYQYGLYSFISSLNKGTHAGLPAYILNQHCVNISSGLTTAPPFLFMKTESLPWI